MQYHYEVEILESFAISSLDMMEAMTQAVRLNSKLDVTERNLLSVACKNVLGNVRTALRQCPVEDTSDDVRKDCITKYRNHLEKEVEDVCSNVIELLDSHLLTKELETEEKVFFLKM